MKRLLLALLMLSAPAAVAQEAREQAEKGRLGAMEGHYGGALRLLASPEVRRAFAEVGYTGYMTTELPGGDETYLRDISRRFDKILAGT